jgi:hypothetical protein
MQKYAICFLTIDIKKELLEFAETLIDSNYDVFICLDNNEIDTSIYNETKITFISINNEEAKNNGFFGSVCYCLDRACSRDKALYYFAKINKSIYDFIWFIEEDVFIPNKNTIKNIDLKYSDNNYDLLCEMNEIKESHNDGSNYWQHWYRLENKIDFPWAHSMICAVRISNKLLNIISDFAVKNKFLLFDETLFNTLALQSNLNIYNPVELSNIVFSFSDIETTNENNINRSYLYHPLKNLKKHEYLHELFINHL